jgi:hypothetical protein
MHAVLDAVFPFLVVPIVSFAWHEAAHALFALALTRGPVLIVVGSGAGPRLRVGRLAVRVSAFPKGGVCVHEPTRHRYDRALIAAAGPISSLLLAAIAWYSHRFAEPFTLFWFTFVWAAVANVATALGCAWPRYTQPATGSGEPRPTDGMLVVRALRPDGRGARS